MSENKISTVKHEISETPKNSTQTKVSFNLAINHLSLITIHTVLDHTIENINFSPKGHST